jgi:hypothetical protein
MIVTTITTGVIVEEIMIMIIVDGMLVEAIQGESETTQGAEVETEVITIVVGGTTAVIVTITGIVTETMKGLEAVMMCVGLVWIAVTDNKVVAPDSTLTQAVNEKERLLET